MNLHHVGKQPDWEKVVPAKRNRWQCVAAATNGIVSIGNFFSVLGLASVPLGLWLLLRHHQGLPAAVVLALGRICDLLDGWLADKTGTKSPLGEVLDVAFDKISVFVTVVVLLAANLIPLWMVTLLVLPHIGVAAIGLLAYFRRRLLHVSRLGKISMGFGWIYLLVWIVSTAVSAALSGLTGRMLIIAGMLALGLSVVTGVASFLGYVRDYPELPVRGR